MFPKHCFICILKQNWPQTSKLLKGLTQVKYYSSGNESDEKQESKPTEKIRPNVQMSDEDLLSCLKQFYNPNNKNDTEAMKESSEHTEVTSEMTIDSLPTSVSSDNCD